MLSLGSINRKEDEILKKLFQSKNDVTTCLTFYYTYLKMLMNYLGRSHRFTLCIINT